MNDVYIVVVESGSYEDYTCDIEAVFDTRERALQFIEKRFTPSYSNYDMTVSIHKWKFGETSDQHDHGNTETVMEVGLDYRWYDYKFEEVPRIRIGEIPDNVSYTEKRTYCMVDITGTRRLVRTEYFRWRANAWVVVEENN